MCDLIRSGLCMHIKFHLSLQENLSALRIFMATGLCMVLTLVEITSAYLNRGHTGVPCRVRESVSTWTRAENEL